MKPRLITTRMKIHGVSAAWDKQYPPDRHGREDQIEIGNRLRHLDLEAATAEDVSGIIGNDSWTWPRTPI